MTLSGFVTVCGNHIWVAKTDNKKARNAASKNTELSTLR